MGSAHPFMRSGDKDQIYGEQSGDLIAGNKGEDRLYCGLGNDIIFAGQILSISNINEFEWQSYSDFVDCSKGQDTEVVYG
jgi:Ca2+-binding RTX toxin-like protein